MYNLNHETNELHKKKVTIYQLLALLAAIGTTASIRFGPGTVAPEVTVYTGLSLLVLMTAEYLWARENLITHGKRVSTIWTITALIMLTLGLFAQLIVLLIASFIWPLALLVAAATMVVLLVKLGIASFKKA